MHLKNIEFANCPVCGDSVIVQEELEVGMDGKVRTHCNGTNWEHRVFSCGQKVSFIPNYVATFLDKYQICKRDNNFIEKKEKRKIAKQKVLSYLENLEEVDAEFKESLISSINYKNI